jgi:hypothetical protein
VVDARLIPRARHLGETPDGKNRASGRLK